MVPAATGTDTAGSLRIPAALSGVCSIKPTAGLASLRGVVPLSYTLDNAGPMARTVEDCALLLGAMAGGDRDVAASALLRPFAAGAPAPPPGPRPLAGVRLAVSPRVRAVALDADVAEGFEGVLATCRALGASVADPPGPGEDLDAGERFLRLLTADMLAYHRSLGVPRDRYRPSIRELLEYADESPWSAADYASAQAERRASSAGWRAWMDEQRVDAILEPTVPLVAPPRGDGYDEFFTEVAIDVIALTHHWNWTGFPVVALPAGVGRASGLPVGVSLAGRPGDDERLLALGVALQRELGVPAPPPPVA
jgi:aspartyl-tRNA(Asn)/glutamyl-tRNA(Gln) amidotransferase subunit A